VSSNRPGRRPPTRAQRRRLDFVKRLFVWLFIVVFAFSVAGAMIVFTAVR